MPKGPTERQSVIGAALRKMKVGDSVLTTDKKPTQLQTTIRRAAGKTGKKFSMRKVENGIRIWRTV